MHSNNNGGYLDELRHNLGTDRFRKEFLAIGKNNKEKTISLVNDNKLHFGTLYIVSPEIEELNLAKSLNSRNSKALKVCDEIKHKRLDLGFADIQTLEWMLQTGAIDDGLDNKFDEILDDCASLLVNTYKDKTILPIVADIIFKRNRNGRFIHDLVWIFFQSCEPHTLGIIANYFRSRNQKDIELASELLSFLSDKENNTSSNILKKYTSSLLWLKENYPYIYFTGENFLLTSNPNPFGVDLEAKYLCKRISHEDKKPLNPHTDNERVYLEPFKKLDNESKKILSKYSHRIHERNINAWNDWMKKPIDNQLEIAKKSLEVYI